MGELPALPSSQGFFVGVMYPHSQPLSDPLLSPVASLLNRLHLPLKIFKGSLTRGFLSLPDGNQAEHFPHPPPPAAAVY